MKKEDLFSYIIFWDMNDYLFVCFDFKYKIFHYEQTSMVYEMLMLLNRRINSQERFSNHSYSRVRNYFRRQFTPIYLAILCGTSLYK